VAAVLKTPSCGPAGSGIRGRFAYLKPLKIAGNCVFELPEGYQLVIAPNHAKNPMLQSGKIDWAKVGRIKVIRIERSHD